MLPFAIAILTVLLAGAASIAPSQAGDAAARLVHGFSPDGRFFAFEQFWATYEDTTVFAELRIIDTTRDVHVDGTPMRVGSRDQDDSELDDIRARLADRAKPLLAKRGTADKGTLFAGRPSRELDDVDHYQLAEPFSPTLDIALPGGRKGRLMVEDRPLGEAVCEGTGGRGGDDQSVAVAGFRLVLMVDGEPVRALHDDKRLPASRRCAQAYGIAEAYLHRATDGEATLVVLIEYADQHDYHAGPNRRFLAVAARLGT